MIIGTPNEFAIEFEVIDPWPYIKARLWAGGKWVGDFEDSLVPGTMAGRFELLYHSNTAVYPFVFCSSDDLPSFGTLLLLGGWSFGESFDKFALVYYKLLAEDSVCLQWKLWESFVDRFPNYPREVISYTIPASIFDDVVDSFLNVMDSGGYYSRNPDK